MNFLAWDKFFVCNKKYFVKDNFGFVRADGVVDPNEQGISLFSLPQFEHTSTIFMQSAPGNTVQCQQGRWNLLKIGWANYFENLKGGSTKSTNF